MIRLWVTINNIVVLVGIHYLLDVGSADGDDAIFRVGDDDLVVHGTEVSRRFSDAEAVMFRDDIAEMSECILHFRLAFRFPFENRRDVGDGEIVLMGDGSVTVLFFSCVTFLSCFLLLLWVLFGDAVVGEELPIAVESVGEQVRQAGSNEAGGGHVLAKSLLQCGKVNDDESLLDVGEDNGVIDGLIVGDRRSNDKRGMLLEKVLQCGIILLEGDAPVELVAGERRVVSDEKIGKAQSVGIGWSIRRVDDGRAILLFRDMRLFVDKVVDVCHDKFLSYFFVPLITIEHDEGIRKSQPADSLIIRCSNE